MPKLVDEVVVVDNNSSDGTGDVARRLGARVLIETRQGYGAAYRAGFAMATGDIIVTMDGDGSYPRNFIPVLLDVFLAEGLDFITCDRTGYKTRGSGTTLRVFGNWVLSVVETLLFWFHVHDSQSGMWVFRRDILPLLELTSDGMSLSEELNIEAFTHPAIRAKELPIYYTARAGESKLNVWRDGFRNLLFLFRKKYAHLTRGRRPVPQGWRQVNATPSPAVPGDAVR
jgi:hypothetical protein